MRRKYQRKQQRIKKETSALQNHNDYKNEQSINNNLGDDTTLSTWIGHGI